MSKPTILCMFSGGVDSAGVLHELLTNEKYSTFDLIVHHIHLWNRENRALVELEAVKNILNYYRNEGKSSFVFTQNTFDTRGFAPLKSNRFPMDMDVCAFTAAQLHAAQPAIKHVAMGRTRSDVEGGGKGFALRMRRAQAIFKSSLTIESAEPAEYIFPVVDFTKREIWDFLPEKVRESSWWCRRPVYKNGSDPQTCGACISCKDMAPIIGNQS
ncbi:MAG: 7-cyano-7-deazaguanine synthase [Reichenbachiella sp.]|uniref:7-cyano-7-deazaguanine synthase n=1 Tax=Reichenbachiella sp. TaxID=2184521 RepID=UPI0032678C4A